jgi:hypothetical protein
MPLPKALHLISFMHLLAYCVPKPFAAVAHAAYLHAA